MNKKFLWHLAFDVFLWANIIAVGLSLQYSLLSSNLLYFFTFLVGIVGIVNGLTYDKLEETRTQWLEVLRDKEIDKSSFQYNYSKYSYFIETLGLAAVGLFIPAIVYFIGCSSLQSTKDKALKEIENERETTNNERKEVF